MLCRGDALPVGENDDAAASAHTRTIFLRSRACFQSPPWAGRARRASPRQESPARRFGSHLPGAARSTFAASQSRIAVEAPAKPCAKAPTAVVHVIAMPDMATRRTCHSFNRCAFHQPAESSESVHGVVGVVIHPCRHVVGSARDCDELVVNRGASTVEKIYTCPPSAYRSCADGHGGNAVASPIYGSIRVTAAFAVLYMVRQPYGSPVAARTPRLHLLIAIQSVCRRPRSCGW